MNILFVGGGSLGHIAPSVAVWEALKELRPDAQALFVCSPRKNDAAFLENASLPFKVFDAPRLSLVFPLKIFKALRKAKHILNNAKPDIIFSKGGYVSIPICLAAKKMNIPIVLHESDTVMGNANRLIAKMANHICTGFDKPSSHQAIKPSTYTGNPIRSNVTKGSKKEGLQITGFDGSRPILLVSGGSQGARDINEAILSMLDDLLLRCDIIHITGRGKSNDQEPITNQQKNYCRFEFVETKLPHLYAITDLAIGRASASFFAEHAANGIPMILIPLRGVGHDHQYKNAQYLASKGACIHLEQSQLKALLLKTVHTLIEDESKRAELKHNMQQHYAPDAALQIAKIIVETLDSSKRGQ